MNFFLDEKETQIPNKLSEEENKLLAIDHKLLAIDYDELRTDVMNKFIIDLMKTKTKFVQEKTYIFHPEFWSTCFMKVMLISLSTSY
jgi:hypothetical protein